MSHKPRFPDWLTDEYILRTSTDYECKSGTVEATFKLLLSYLPSSGLSRLEQLRSKIDEYKEATHRFSSTLSRLQDERNIGILHHGRSNPLKRSVADAEFMLFTRRMRFLELEMKRTSALLDIRSQVLTLLVTEMHRDCEITTAPAGPANQCDCLFTDCPNHFN